MRLYAIGHAFYPEPKKGGTVFCYLRLAMHKNDIELPKPVFKLYGKLNKIFSSS